MTLPEEIIYKRELLMFIGVENHSTPYNPCLYNKLWAIPDNIPHKDVLIIPIQGLDSPYLLLENQVMCFGRLLWILYVESSFLNHNVILFDSFPQTDENTYFIEETLSFLGKCNCSCVTVCDIGIYKSRSFVNLLNSAISSLCTHNISVCLATILGYNSRGYTDIETGKENTIYNKNYYLQPSIEVSIQSDKFEFIQIDNKFTLDDMYKLCSLTKNPADTTFQFIKKKAAPYESTLKPLVDSGALKLILTSFNKSDTFDFVSFTEYLSKIGFKGELIDSQWNVVYEKMCSSIRNSKIEDRELIVQELISEIIKNINSTISLVKSI
ncbi:MAG: hypothetical protein MJZ41_06600 [Bacteroidaceae bacterium]|nr:hypothetical protein [Bacteroidaceae bacterium]